MIVEQLVHSLPETLVSRRVWGYVQPLTQLLHGDLGRTKVERFDLDQLDLWRPESKLGHHVDDLRQVRRWKPFLTVNARPES